MFLAEVEQAASKEKQATSALFARITDSKEKMQQRYQDLEEETKRIATLRLIETPTIRGRSTY